jgi:hypothetical protein
LSQVKIISKSIPSSWPCVFHFHHPDTTTR